MVEYSIRPEAVSAASFAKAIEELAAALGPDAVVTSPEALAPYRKIYIPVSEDSLAGSGTLIPTSVEQVQKIVVICNKYRIPIWPISTGRNIGMGSAAPARRGAMVLDLRRMNRIIEVDADIASALIEPGVTYRQLKDHLEEHNLPFWVDAPSPGPIVSPIGNTLERGNGYTTNHDHMASFAGMEVVLPNGDLIRTGMGALPNCKSWQAYRYGYGPYIDGLFTQSNYGIVTKMGIWLTPVAEGAKPFAAHFAKREDLAAAIDTFRKLKLAGTISVTGSVLDGLTQYAFGKSRRDIYDGPGAIPRDLVEKLLKERGIPHWRVGGVVYGDDEETAIKLRKIGAAYKTAGAAEVFVDGKGDPASIGDLAQATGQISLINFKILNYVGGGGVAWHMPVTAMKGEWVQQLCAISESVLNRFGFDYMAMNWCNDRDMHQTTGILFDRSDAEQMKRAHDCYHALMQETSNAGFGNYRASVHYMDQAADLFGPALRNFHRTIKRAIDPNGIIAPGKSGISV